jgi:hypothetical protein
MRDRALLTIDAAADLILGALLVAAPRQVIQWIGAPRPSTAFYPSILGAVLFGIGVALLIERFQRGPTSSGLGILGAIWINLSGGVVLAGWLLLGRLRIPARGIVALWCIAAIVLSIGTVELVSRGRKKTETGD